MDRFMIDKYAGRGGHSITKSFSPYDSDGAKSELDKVVADVKLMRDRAKMKAEEEKAGQPKQRLIDKANEAKKVAAEATVKKTSPEASKDPSETDEQIRKKLEIAKNANITATGKVSSNATTEEILDAALKDLF